MARKNRGSNTFRRLEAKVIELAEVLASTREYDGDRVANLKLEIVTNSRELTLFELQGLALLFDHVDRAATAIETVRFRKHYL